VTEEPRLDVVNWAPCVTPASGLAHELVHLELRVLVPKLRILSRESDILLAVIAILVDTLRVGLWTIGTSFACFECIGILG